jgi:hypothetical protein
VDSESAGNVIPAVGFQPPFRSSERRFPLAGYFIFVQLAHDTLAEMEYVDEVVNEIEIVW